VVVGTQFNTSAATTGGAGDAMYTGG